MTSWAYHDANSLHVAVQRRLADLLAGLHVTVLRDGKIVQVQGQPPQTLVVRDAARGQINIESSGGCASGSGVEQHDFPEFGGSGENLRQLGQRLGREIGNTDDSSAYR